MPACHMRPDPARGKDVAGLGGDPGLSLMALQRDRGGCERLAERRKVLAPSCMGRPVPRPQPQLSPLIQILGLHATPSQLRCFSASRCISVSDAAGGVLPQPVGG